MDIYSVKQQQRRGQEVKERVSARLLDINEHFEATAISYKNKETRELLTVTYARIGHAAEYSTSSKFQRDDESETCYTM